MAYSYSTNITEKCAKAVGVSLPISTKISTEICNALRGLRLEKAKKFLEEVVEMKRAVPIKRYNDNTGHKPGMAAGSYPVTACSQILFIIKSAEANAQFKGLSTGTLFVKHISAQKGPTVWHYGRQRRRQAKRTHIEVVLEEKKLEEKTPAKKRAAKNSPTKSAEQAKTKEAKS